MILVFALLLAQQLTPAAKCTLSGTVTDSVTGLPLAKVVVVAEHVGSSYDPGASTTTDTKGNFLLIDIDPGQYRLSARRSGYIDSYYGAKKPKAAGSAITLTAGQKLEDLGIRLPPFGVIAGTLRDTDGEPMMDENVNVYRLGKVAGKARMFFASSRRTDDLGQYRVVDLPPGKYYVVAIFTGTPGRVDHSVKSADRPEAPVTTFYPGTTDPTAARPVELGVGTRLTGIDIAIVRSHAYKIGIHVDVAPGFRASASLVYTIDGLYPAGMLFNADRNNDIEISGVPPGSYNLRVFASPPDKPDVGVREFCETSVPVAVDREDLKGLRVSVNACAIATGRVTVEGASQPAPGGIMVDFEGEQQVYLRPDGSFTTSLSPGANKIDLSRIVKEKGLYVRSIRAGNQDVMRNGFSLAASEHIDLEIVLASDGGSVQGIVSDAEDKPVAGATVALIPNDPVLRARPDFAKDGVTDQLGHFELKNAAPGEYKLFSWEDVETDSWLDPDILKDYEGKGEPVTVKVKDSQSVNLRVIR